MQLKTLFHHTLLHKIPKVIDTNSYFPLAHIRSDIISTSDIISELYSYISFIKVKEAHHIFLDILNNVHNSFYLNQTFRIHNVHLHSITLEILIPNIDIFQKCFKIFFELHILIYKSTYLTVPLFWPLINVSILHKSQTKITAYESNPKSCFSNLLL